MSQLEQDCQYEFFAPPTKKIKWTPSEASIQYNRILLDQSCGSPQLQKFYQNTIDRDVQQFVILQLMKDFGEYMNNHIMKNIPEVLSFDKLCRERGIILDLIKEGLLYESMHGRFLNVKSFVEKDAHAKKVLFTKHQYETMEQYKRFIMSAIYYDREGIIFELVDESIRNDVEFALRATLSCPKILYKHPDRFLNLKFAIEYTKREHPKTAMQSFLKDNESPILESSEFKTSIENDLVTVQPSSVFTSARTFLNLQQSSAFISPNLSSYRQPINSGGRYEYFYNFAPQPLGHKLVLPTTSSNQVELHSITISLDNLLLCTHLMFEGMEVGDLVATLIEHRGFLCNTHRVRMDSLGVRCLKEFNVKYLCHASFVRELGLIFGYLYRKQ